jgi:hypothetical protein
LLEDERIEFMLAVEPDADDANVPCRDIEGPP